jgi:endonuclease-8
VPEGDTVWRTARRLHRALAGRELLGSDLRWPSLATVDLSGREVVEVVSAGKHILTRVTASGDDPPVTLHSHLRMEGSWYLERTGDGQGRRSAAGIRAVLTTAEWTAVGHKLGMLDLVSTDREDELVGHLGPDLLGPGWDPVEARRRLLEDPRRELGEALLDQRVLAGVGTLYMAEACFLVRLTPWSPVSDLEDPDGFVALLHRLLHFNKDRSAQVTTGDLRQGRQHFAHARSGLPCLRCAGTVRVAPIGAPPKDRTAFYCPGCQRGPTPTDDGRPQRPLGSSGRPSATRGYRTRR